MIRSENMLRKIRISFFIMLCFNSCVGPSYEKTFLSKYEFEDFSQFNEINIFKRGGDENNQCIAIDEGD